MQIAFAYFTLLGTTQALIQIGWIISPEIRLNFSIIIFFLCTTPALVTIHAETQF